MPESPATPETPAKPEGAFLVLRDAAALCNKSEATLSRYRRNDKLPNSRRNADRHVEVAVADLVACGLLDPLAAAGPVSELADRSRAARDLVLVRQELAVATVRIEALTDRLISFDAEVCFLRGQLKRQGQS